jgi:hypothetical protein
MVTVNKPVDIVTSDGKIVAGEFTLWEEAPDDPDHVRVDLRFADEGVTAVADTFFDALAEIRKVIENKGLRPRCFGASRDVYPSPMIRSMGSGDKAYRLRLGCPAKTEDLVPIFASDPEIIVTSVEGQEEFYQKWPKSLK